MAHTAVLLPLCPNRHQEAVFWRCAGVARWTYNWALATKKAEYESTGKSSSAYDLSKRLTTMKRTPEFSWLCDVSKMVPQCALRNLDMAFKRFFAKKASYPKFKKRGKCTPSFMFADTWVSTCLRGRHIMLSRIGLVRIAERHPSIPEGHVLNVTVKHVGDRWWAAVTIELPEQNVEPNGLPPVGVDVGITSFATLSTGEKITGPQPLRRALRKLKRLHRSLSRSQKGSRRRERKRRVLARAYARTRNIRQNFTHQLTTRLAKNHGTVVIEDLNVRGMLRNRHLALSIGDAGWGEFRRQLAYKCLRHGSSLVVADRWFASSKRCSDCGHVLESLPLSVRLWTCPECGSEHDRDVNAAKNLDQLGWNPPEVTRVETGVQGFGPQPVVETRSTGKADAKSVC